MNSKNLEFQDDQSLHSNSSANKISSGSLNKYNKSPYLQSTFGLNLEFTQGFVLPKKPNPGNLSIGGQGNSRIKEAEVNSPSKENKKNEEKPSLFKKADNLGY